MKATALPGTKPSSSLGATGLLGHGISRRQQRPGPIGWGPSAGALQRAAESSGLRQPRLDAQAVIQAITERLDREAIGGRLAITVAGNDSGAGQGELSLKTTAADGTTVEAFLQSLAAYPSGARFLAQSGIQRITVAFIDDAEWKRFQDLYQARTGLRPPDNEPGYNTLARGPDGEQRMVLMLREDQTRAPATLLREGIYGVLLEQLLVRGKLLSPQVDQAIERNYRRLTRGQPAELSAAAVPDFTQLRGLWKKNAAGDGFVKMPLALYKELTARLLGNLIARQLLAHGKRDGMNVKQYATALFHPDPAKTFSVIASPDEAKMSYRRLAQKLLEIDYADLLYYGGLLEVSSPPELGFFSAQQQIAAEAWATAHWSASSLAARLADAVPNGLDRAISKHLRRLAG